MIAYLNLTFKAFYILASNIISKFNFLFPFLNSYSKDCYWHFNHLAWCLHPLPNSFPSMHTHTDKHTQTGSLPPAFLSSLNFLSTTVSHSFKFQLFIILHIYLCAYQSLLLLGKFWRLILPVINWFVIWSWGEVFYAYELKEKQSREWLMKKYKNCHVGKSRTAKRNKQTKIIGHAEKLWNQWSLCFKSRITSLPSSLEFKPRNLPMWSHTISTFCFCYSFLWNCLYDICLQLVFVFWYLLMSLHPSS